MFKFYSLISRKKLQYIYDLLLELILRDFKLRYKRSVLGIGWALLTPILQLFIYYFIFQLILSFNIPNYAAFIFIGVISWNWFESSLFRASTSITESLYLIKQPGFYSFILPIVAVSINLINFLISVPILWILVLLSDNKIEYTILFLPAVVFIQFVFTLGLSYFVAAINVIFRDIQHILVVLMRLWFFATPIFYNIDIVPKKYLIIFTANPMFHLINAYRKLIINGVFPDWWSQLFLFLLSCIFFIIGFYFFNLMKLKFVEEL
jgi:lipopolysaccharide transport system permease protein